jgi:GNAT superfamily N-acetyltransferase
MTDALLPLIIRPARLDDFAAWQPLWEGYNAFYGRSGSAALPSEITDMTWRRFFDPVEPVFALVAEAQGRLLGLTHYLYHRSTTRIELTCYLNDLFTAQSQRGRGVGRALVRGVYQSAKEAGVRHVYWQTHESNSIGRRLYETMAINEGFVVYSHDT